MGTPREKPALDYAAYLELENASDERHAFHDGEAYAMAGGTPAHGRLIAQVSGSLYVALKGKPCMHTSSEQRVRIGEAHAVYPDAMVVCPPVVRASDDVNAITNPVVLVEVLSATTEAWDRGGKFELYRGLPSLRHVVLVRQDAWRVEHFRRMDDGTWRLSVHGPGDALALDTVDATLGIDDLYDGIEAFGGPPRG